MDQLRLDFKLKFPFFKKNINNNYLYFYKYYTHPALTIRYFSPDIDYSDNPLFYPNLLQFKVVEVDNGEIGVYFKKFFTNTKKIKCKKILHKQKCFINLVYF